MPLSTPEKKIKDWLDRQPHDVTVYDVIRQFAKVPYGWSDFATIYFLNELVRRHEYAFNYNNNPNVSREDTARNIVRDASKFTVEKAKAISQEILNDFIDAWKHIFNVMSIKGSNDSTELFRNCKETDDSALNKLLKNYRELSRKVNGCPFAHTIDEAIILMEKWLTVRDHQKFFETIIAAKDEASILFDRCKSINTFFGDHFENYQKIRKFIDDNRDNFAFLNPDQQASAATLRAINSDEEPWNKMPAYMKLMKTINGQLQEKKKDLVAVITTKYNTIFDNLEKYASDMQVAREKFAKRDITISLKTNTNNLYALQANLNNSPTFYEEEMQKINAAIQTNPDKPASSTKKDEDGGKSVPDEKETHPGPRPRIRKVVTLSTQTTEPMHTEADIDLYLQSLKVQLMQYLGEDNDIIVN